MTNSEALIKEYNDYRDRIEVWKKQHGIFHNDIKKLEDSVDKMMDQRSDVLIDYRRTKKQRYLDEADQILENAINHIKKLKSGTIGITQQTINTSSSNVLWLHSRSLMQ